MQRAYAYKKFLDLHPLFLGVISGFIGVLASRLPRGWPLIFIALVPLIFASLKARSWKIAGAAGAAAGILFCANGSWWMFEALPLPDSYGAGSALQGFAMVSFSWCAVILATGIWTGFFTAVLSCLRLDRVWKLFAAAAFYLFSQVLSLVAFNILTTAPQIHNPLFYSPGFIGYPLADSASFLQAAAVGGIWTLTGIAVFANLLVYFFLEEQKKHGMRNLAILSSALFLISVAPVASLRARMHEAPTTEVPVAFMSVGMSMHDVPFNADYVKRSTELMRQAVARAETANAQVVLTPEDERVFVPEGVTRVKDVIGASRSTVVHGGMSVAYKEHAALAGYASNAAGDTWLRNKMVLVPHGEYLTSAFSAILHLFGAGTAADAFVKIHPLTNGEIGNPAVVGPVRASLMYCSELLMPDLANEMVRMQKANLLLISSAHSVFLETRVLEEDTLRYAKVQTVEAGVPSVSSVENGSAYALDRYGRMTAYVRAEKNTVAVGITQAEIEK